MNFLFLFLLFLSSSLPGIEDHAISVHTIHPIENLKDDRNYILLKEIIKENLKERKVRNLALFSYTIKDNEDFYYVMAKTSSDHTTLLSVNKSILGISLKDFKKGQKIYIPGIRGYFSEKEMPSSKKVYIKTSEITLVLYLQPFVRNLDIYHENVSGSVSNKDVILKENRKDKEGYFPPLQVGGFIITSPFGWRKHPLTDRLHFHRGIDLRAPLRSPVYAPVSGNITFAGYKKGYGKTVILYRQKESSSETEEFLFAHLIAIAVKEGSRVEKGTVLGYTGASGTVTGPHLHLEYRKNSRLTDPQELLPEWNM